MGDIIIYVARWWEKYFSKRSLIKHTCSWRYKLIVLRILNRQGEKILRISLCYVGLNFSLCVNITSQYNVYSVVWRKKHGQNILKVVRKYEKRQLQLLKVQADIKVIKTCKSECLILIFVNVKLSIKSQKHKMKSKPARLIMETELHSKHDQKKKIKKELASVNITLKSSAT